MIIITEREVIRLCARGFLMIYFVCRSTFCLRCVSNKTHKAAFNVAKKALERFNLIRFLMFCEWERTRLPFCPCELQFGSISPLKRKLIKIRNHRRTAGIWYWNARNLSLMFAAFVGFLFLLSLSFHYHRQNVNKRRNFMHLLSLLSLTLSPLWHSLRDLRP